MPDDSEPVLSEVLVGEQMCASSMEGLGQGVGGQEAWPHLVHRWIEEGSTGLRKTAFNQITAFF